MTVIPLRPRLRVPTAREDQLPPGRWHDRIWVSDEPLSLPDQYLHCVRRFPNSGLWPVLIPPDGRFASAGEDWIDDRAFFRPAVEQIAARDPAAVLAQWWRGECCGPDCLAPFESTFPGLARRSSRRCDALAAAASKGLLLASVRPYRLGLVNVEHPADVPAALGWAGAGNWTQDVAAISAVLRSWEERFGAVLIVLGFDALQLSVAAAPTTQERAQRTAAEHISFCPDNFRGQPGSLRDLAGGLVGNQLWRFWWD